MLFNATFKNISVISIMLLHKINKRDVERVGDGE
jgi:hypothetical protein